MSPRLEVCGLRVETSRGAAVVEDVSFTLAAGEVLGLVGESGSGKTTVALSLLGYARPGVHIAGGKVRVAGREILALSERERRTLRGRVVSYVPQEAAKSLNPSMRVGEQLRELMDLHLPDGSSWDKIGSALTRVNLPADKDFRRRFPHQLSGGQQQRLTLGFALACDPEVIVLDEPTTGLDVITQARILAELARICRDVEVAAVFVSHDLAAVAVVASRLAVMYAGRLVELGPVKPVIADPLHPYTAGLIASVPLHQQPQRVEGIPGTAVGVGDRPPGCAFAPRCVIATAECEAAVPELLEIRPGRAARCIHVSQTPRVTRLARDHFVPTGKASDLLHVDEVRADYGRGARRTTVVHGVTLTVASGECVALVGESGSGKSTIARCVAGLHAPSGGAISFDGETLAPAARKRSRAARRRIQIVFQNPYDSLNPRVTVGAAVARPLAMLRGLHGREARREVVDLLEQVRLPSHLADRFPAELSGGERQRVAIARALAAGPDLLLCDEVTSALDVSVQAAVLALLGDLQRNLGLALLFITHDLGVVANVADRVLVLEQGVVRERGNVADVLGHPTADYTRQLIAAVPELPVGGSSRIGEA